jgi:hypothetical protein
VHVLQLRAGRSSINAACRHRSPALPKRWLCRSINLPSSCRATLLVRRGRTSIQAHVFHQRRSLGERDAGRSGSGVQRDIVLPNSSPIVSSAPKGVKRTLAAAKRRARRRRQPASTHGPRPSTTCQLCAGQSGGPNERDGTSPPNARLIGTAPNALLGHLPRITARCRVRCTRALGGPTGDARASARVCGVGCVLSRFRFMPRGSRGTAVAPRCSRNHRVTTFANGRNAARVGGVAASRVIDSSK